MTIVRVEAVNSIVGYHIHLGRKVTEKEMDNLDDLFYEGIIDEVINKSGTTLFIEVPGGLDEKDMKRLMECFDDDNL